MQAIPTPQQEIPSRGALDRRPFAEESDSPAAANLSMSLSNMGNGNNMLNKKAASFVGQGFSDALPDSDDYKKKASASFCPQTFKSMSSYHNNMH